MDYDTAFEVMLYVRDPTDLQRIRSSNRIFDQVFNDDVFWMKKIEIEYPKVAKQFFESMIDDDTYRRLWMMLRRGVIYTIKLFTSVDRLGRDEELIFESRWEPYHNVEAVNDSVLDFYSDILSQYIETVNGGLDEKYIMDFRSYVEENTITFLIFNNFYEVTMESNIRKGKVIVQEVSRSITTTQKKHLDNFFSDSNVNIGNDKLDEYIGDLLENIPEYKTRDMYYDNKWKLTTKQELLRNREVKKKWGHVIRITRRVVKYDDIDDTIGSEEYLYDESDMP